MKVTFFRPPIQSIVGMTNPTVPLGIAYLSSVLKKHGFQTALVDGEKLNPSRNQVGVIKKLKSYLQPSKVSAEGQKLLKLIMEDSEHSYWRFLVEKILVTKPDMVAISAFSQHITAVNIVAKNLKEILPEVPIVIGGVHATALPMETMTKISEIDFLIAGDGENRLLALCECIKNKRLDEIRTVDSLYYRDKGLVRKSTNPLFAEINNLDELPFMDRFISSSDGGYERGAFYSVPIVPGRGCPYRCAFCAASGKKIRFRSANDILAEILEVSNRTGATRFGFVVDTLTTNKQKFFEICKQIKKVNDRKLTFSINSRVSEVNEDVFEEMKKAGIDSIGFGIESGSQTILDRIKKGITISQVIKAIDLANKYKIFCTCNFIIGHPGETESDVLQTISLAKKISSKYINFEINLMTPYPGTELYDLSKEKGYEYDIKTYYRLYHQGDVVVNLTDMDDEKLDYLYRKIQKKFSRHAVYINVYRIIGKLSKILLKNNGLA